MRTFLKSLLPVFKKSRLFKKYLIEVILILISSIVAIISIVCIINIPKTEVLSTVQEPNMQTDNDYKKDEKKYIDISGAVNVPGLYEASDEARLNDLIDMAGGLSEVADKNFFSRNFNLAKLVVDQEKIYIPSKKETENGYNVQFEAELANSNTTYKVKSTERININLATLEELDTLPGVGKVTAEKIINNRPFGALDELIIKKVINKSVYQNILDLIEI